MTAERSNKVQHEQKSRQQNASEVGSEQQEYSAPSLDLTPEKILNMQRLVGNSAIMRMLDRNVDRRSLQRIPHSPTTTTTTTTTTADADPQAADRQLAQRLVSVLQDQGGLNLAIYLINIDDDPNVYENDDEFKTQAVQYARDHMTFGVRNGTLQQSVAIGIDEAVSAEVEHVITAANALLSRFPDLTPTPVTARVQTLNVFTHGTRTGLASGHTGNRWQNASRFVNGLAQYMSATPTINLYACSTTGVVRSGGQNFATAVQQQLTNDLRQIHGDEAGAHVWGHSSARHTTYNPDLGEVSGGDTVGLQANLANRLVAMALMQRGNVQPTPEQQNSLQTAANRAIANVFPNGRYTGSRDPRQVYFRDIPLLGMDRVWRDFSGSTAPTDYTDLGMSTDAATRMLRGATLFRADFQAQLTTFNTRADSILGVSPGPNPPDPIPPDPIPPVPPTPIPPTPIPPAPVPPQPVPPVPVPPQPVPPHPVPPQPPTPVTDRPMLRHGSRGDDVRDLQERLNARGMAAPPLAVDGIFGDLTLAAVRQFQTAQSLQVDGIVGPRTWDALLSSSNQNPPVPVPPQPNPPQPNPPSPVPPAPVPPQPVPPVPVPPQPVPPHPVPPQPVPPSEVEQWVTVLPRMQRTAQQRITVTLSERREAPTLSNAELGPEGELTAQQQQLVAGIQANRATIDTTRLRLVQYAGHFGYSYSPSTRTDPTPTAVQGEGDTPQKRAEQAVWEELRHEGSTSSINAWDSQMVTWGRGLGGRSGPMVRTVMRLLFENAEIASAFRRQGINYNNGLEVVNVQTGAVETGQNALALMQADPQLLGVLIDIAEHPNFRQMVTDAQWEGARSTGTARVPEFALTWQRELIQMVAHITHWGPAYGWHNNADAYRAANGDALQIMLAFLRRASGGANANGSFSLIGNGATSVDLMQNLERWGGGIGARTIQSNFQLREATPNEVRTDPTYAGRYVVRNGRNAQRQEGRLSVYVH